MEMNDLFGDLGNTMEFTQDKPTSSKDGLYRVDLKKAKEGKWRSVIRFLPNFTNDQEMIKKYNGPIGPSGIEKITHYVNIPALPELKGFYDSPKNLGEKCALSDVFYQLRDSNNAILQANAKLLNYSKKYYSYVLVVEDEQQPELVGKVMVFQYGKTIKDKILQQERGEITGIPKNPFRLADGSDFVLLVKEIDTGDTKYPDYKSCQFQPLETSIKILNDEGVLINVPTLKDANDDTQIVDEYKVKVKNFLLERSNELETWSPKKLTEEQQVKVSDIIAYITGKTSTTAAASTNQPNSDDFSFDVASTPTDTTTVEDFDFDID